MAKIDPTAARTAFLDTLTPEDQNHVLRRAEKSGPARDDADWLIAFASMKAAERIEAAVAGVELKSGNGKTTSRPTSAKSNSTALVLWTFVVSLSTFAGIGYAVELLSPSHLQSLVLYSIAFACGGAGTTLYSWAAPYFIKRSERKR